MLRWLWGWWLKEDKVRSTSNVKHQTNNNKPLFFEVLLEGLVLLSCLFYVLQGAMSLQALS